MLPSLDVDGLVLRPVRSSDLPGWLDYLQSAPVREGISWRPRRVADLEAFVDATDVEHAPGQIRFAMARQADDALVGTVGLHSIVREHRVAEVAYDLHPAHWGRGWASAACAGMLRWARAQGLYRIQATVLAHNLASQRVLGRCGFRREGVLRGYRWVDGAPRHALLFSSIPGDP